MTSIPGELPQVTKINVISASPEQTTPMAVIQTDIANVNLTENTTALSVGAKRQHEALEPSEPSSR